MGNLVFLKHLKDFEINTIRGENLIEKVKMKYFFYGKLEKWTSSLTIIFKSNHLKPFGLNLKPFRLNLNPF